MSIPELKSPDQYQQLIEKSHQQPVFVLKHSTRCPTSSDAYEEFQEFASLAGSASVVCAFVKVIEYRPVSQYIEQHTGVPHQSPQVILLHHGKPVWSAAHVRITKRALAAEAEHVLEPQKFGNS